MWQSSNPALANDDAFAQFYGKAMFDTRTKVATLQGVVNKTAILTVIAVAAGTLGYWLFSTHPMTLWLSNLVGFIVVMAVYFVIRGKPQASVYLAPVYAVVEGVFLGGFTALAEYLLAQRNIHVPGGVALQAFIITGCALGSMLALYSMRILRPTQTFRNVISTATGAIALTYLVSFILSLFGVHLPFITMFSAANATGGAALIGLGVNLFILAIASLGLIIDFGMIEERLQTESPRYIEWYCGFALLVTLAWIYYESVKIVLRVAALVNRR
jgi:uncharacterized YccA/Bax inhibitor family protein